MLTFMSGGVLNGMSNMLRRNATLLADGVALTDLEHMVCSLDAWAGQLGLAASDGHRGHHDITRFRHDSVELVECIRLCKHIAGGGDKLVL